MAKGVTMNGPEGTSLAEDQNDGNQPAEVDLREMLEGATAMSQASRGLVINTDIG